MVAYSFAYYSNSLLCLALFEPHPASALCLLCQARAARQYHSKTSNKALCFTTMVELKTPLLHYTLYIHSSDHRLMWWMMCLLECLCSDPVSEASSACLDNSIYRIHCVWSHCINIWACSLFNRGVLTFRANSEWIHYPEWKKFVLQVLLWSRITFCLCCRRVGAYSARLRSKDLQLEDNRCLICAVMWDEVKADRGTVMNLYEMSCPALLQSQVSCNHIIDHFYPFSTLKVGHPKPLPRQIC